MLDFIGLHLLKNRMGFLILRWYFGNMLFQMLLNLTLGLRNETQTPLVTGDPGSSAYRKGTCIPERIEQTGASAKLVDTLLTPVEMIILFLR